MRKLAGKRRLKRTETAEYGEKWLEAPLYSPRRTLANDPPPNADHGWPPIVHGVAPDDGGWRLGRLAPRAARGGLRRAAAAVRPARRGAAAAAAAADGGGAVEPDGVPRG